MAKFIKSGKVGMYNLLKNIDNLTNLKNEKKNWTHYEKSIFVIPYDWKTHWKNTIIKYLKINLNFEITRLKLNKIYHWRFIHSLWKKKNYNLRFTLNNEITTKL